MDAYSFLTSAGVATGAGWEELGELGLAFALSSLIGLEREWRQKSAGLRTHALVGVGAALFMLVSMHGFNSVAGPGVNLDPSRVAAQIVTGIGFIGGGLIFVRGDAVRGLTTAATVWITAAVGMACGGGMALFALAVTASHFVVAFIYPSLAARLPRSRYLGFELRVVYRDGEGTLRRILAEATGLGFTIARVNTQRLDREVGGGGAAAVTMEVRGQPSADPLALAIDDLDGVHEVDTSDLAEDGA